MTSMKNTTNFVRRTFLSAETFVHRNILLAKIQNIPCTIIIKLISDSCENIKLIKLFRRTKLPKFDKVLDILLQVQPHEESHRRVIGRGAVLRYFVVNPTPHTHTLQGIHSTSCLSYTLQGILLPVSLYLNPAE